MSSHLRDTTLGSIRFRDEILLFLASTVALYFELLIIRYLSTEVRLFTNLKNLPLVASFFGMGLGVLLGSPRKTLRIIFPGAAVLLFVITRFAQPLHLSFGDVSWDYSLGSGNVVVRFLTVIGFLVVSLGYCALIVVFFCVLGGFIGKHLRQVLPLKGYGINLAGSLLGLALFSSLAVLHFGPGTWLAIGFALLAPLIVHNRLLIVVFSIIVVLVAIPQPNTYWSPYYRLDLIPVPPPPGYTQPAAYSLVASHAWYQWLADLSTAFLTKFPNAEPNRSLSRLSEIPYELVPHPKTVLVLGAGTGNDVASALRHGAEHVDAVEIDPVIAQIGRTRHPEHPYDSPRVQLFVDDARAFLKKTDRKYDLVLFAYLDSATLLSSFSSLRLDNYVYTLESFEDAKAALNERGSLVLSFATGRSFTTQRLYATLERAFGVPPAAYYLGSRVTDTILIEGVARDTKLIQFTDASQELQAAVKKYTLLATDNWPFLYLVNRSVPNSILVTSCLFLLIAWIVLRRAVPLGWHNWPMDSHFFLLGAGFLLLETKAVTQLALIFGNTWAVNSIVIVAFLTVALAANAMAGVYRVPRVACYVALLTLLIVDFFFPYSKINSLSHGSRLLIGGGWAALPVFFSGLVFSSGLRRFENAAEALGLNLFGTVVGGVLENAVMVGGMSILKILAVVVYLLSGLVLLKNQVSPRHANERACSDTVCF